LQDQKTLKAKMTVKDKLYYKHAGRCAYCGVVLQDDWEIDHIKPVKGIRGKADLNAMSNFNPSCKKCNASKGDKNIEQWREMLQKHLHETKDKNTAMRVCFQNTNFNYLPVRFYFELEKISGYED
jgi:5-methylcytosine-specific restriction endonuclease McrA